MNRLTATALTLVTLVTLVTLALPRVAAGQDTAATRDTTARSAANIPVAARPPAGMCRVWLDQVPAAQQPAPTDCASAVRNRPARGRVVFGDDYVTTKHKGAPKAAPFMKGFGPKPDARKPATRPDSTSRR